MALYITQGTRKKFGAQIVHHAQRYFSAGWRVPRALSARQHEKESTERIQVPIPGNAETLELCFKQKFTASPGSVTNNRDMTGTRVWPTARAVVTRLNGDLDELRRKKPSLRILELGAGCGLLGMTLAATGDEVLLTDYAGNIEWLRANVKLNATVLGSRATTAELNWGDTQDMSTIETEVGDEGFDAIVGSDVIYDATCHHALTETMRRFATSARAPVFLGYPDRNSSESDFLQTAEKYFDIEISEMISGESNLMYAVCQIRP